MPLEEEIKQTRREYYVHVDSALAHSRLLLPVAMRDGDPFLIGRTYQTIARYYLYNGLQEVPAIC